jgi:hypothetical protein
MRVLRLWLGGVLLLIAGCTHVYHLELENVPPPLCVCASATLDACAPCYDVSRFPMGE